MNTKQTTCQRIFFACASTLVTQSVAATAAHANLIPTSWSISVGVQETASNGFSDQVVDSSHTVQAPVANFSQSAVFGPSLSEAQYAFNIGQTVADYVVNLQHRCVNHLNGDFIANPRCVTFGRIILTPSVDVLLTADLGYSYFMPSDPEGVGFNLSARLSNPSETLFGFGQGDNTDTSGPHGGAFSVSGASALLPAGRTATIQYTIYTTYYPGSATGLLATGDGSVHLTMTALPEPAALGPLAFAALLMRKRRLACR